MLTVQVISNSSVVLLDENAAWCNMPMERSWLHIRSNSVHLYTVIDRAVLTSVPTLPLPLHQYIAFQLAELEAVQPQKTGGEGTHTNRVIQQDDFWSPVAVYTLVLTW